jgi:copper chaperone
MATQELLVSGMHCGSCGMLIDEALEELAGVASSDTNVRKGRTKVDYDPARTSVDEIVKEIAGLGYAVQLP